MSQVVIAPAESAHDDAISLLARTNGLSVDPRVERERKDALFLSAVEEGGRVVGFVSARLALDEAEIFDVCVEERERRRGIARALLVELLRRLGERKIRVVFLEVRADNEPAQRLYVSTGFERVGERKGYYSDGVDALLFRCCLAPVG